MVPFISRGINDPWSDTDIKRYEAEGSQRDSVIYNSYYNSRTLLTEKNIFLCSMGLNDNLYKNFYLVAVTRSLFYYIAYIPEMLCMRELKNEELVKKLFSKLILHKTFAESFDTNVEINDSIYVSDGCAIIVKVNANIEEFLFPRYGEINNQEIRKKFVTLSKLYERFQEERKVMVRVFETYHSKMQEKQDAIKKKFTRITIRKTALIFAPMLLGMPSLPLELDSLFGLGDMSDWANLEDITSSAFSMIDISDMADLANIADVDDFMDMSDMQDCIDPFLSSDSFCAYDNENSSSINSTISDYSHPTFAGNPPNSGSDGYIHTGEKYNGFDVYRKNCHRYYWDNYKDVWIEIKKK
jgi:hypothetical protein